MGKPLWSSEMNARAKHEEPGTRMTGVEDEPWQSVSFK